ncbi:hypothetical protein AGR7C_Lc20023 [Agrobacterium deltaense Zutra 3/1]|uniref:Acyltransferase 3 domain-containing protein n=1 Tax=Agrobacterium deltaense Zutra 3/1 TaxID=1183427 RepID=A0A1S7RJN8_9HYPH|nr:hypothetical protein AGR7C_Lc20023 [Agrobacterium deltaense Zutra 3/1]
MSTSGAAMQKVYSIQFLRALAAFSVLLFHIVGDPFTIGAAGVDVFFVISGLIMGSFATAAGPGAFFISQAGPYCALILGRDPGDVRRCDGGRFFHLYLYPRAFMEIAAFYSLYRR